MNSIPPTLVISLDFELAWGSFDKKFDRSAVDCARWAHQYGVSFILDTLTRNKLSATWATVGLVMLDKLPASYELAEVHYPHFPYHWFHHVPKQEIESLAPEWLGASLVRMIRQAKPTQEIAFHSFSHVLFGHPGTPRERAREEFESCVALAKELGIAPDSFVFPRNSIAHLDLLEASGFRYYRAQDQLSYGPAGGRKLRSLLSVLADVLGLAPPIVQPSLQNGLVALPGSLMIRQTTGWRGMIPDACRLRRLRQGLKKVCAEGGVFSVWFHPEHLYHGRPRLERLLTQFMSEAGALIDEGKLRCLTLAELGREFLETARH